jgi:hypothetical protein
MNFLYIFIATVLIILIIKPDSTVAADTTLGLKNMMGFKIKLTFITSDGYVLSNQYTLEDKGEREFVVQKIFSTIGYIHIQYYYYFMWITDDCLVELKKANNNCFYISSNWFTGCYLKHWGCLHQK